MAKANFKFDPFKLAGVRAPTNRAERRRALEEMRDFIRDSILDHVGDSKSPVRGGPWKTSLTSGYKKVKDDFSSVLKANLELRGDLLDALEVRIEGNQLNAGVFDRNEVGKAEGNNIGSYGKSRGSVAKARRFIPLRGETWNREITEGIKDIAAFFEGDE